MRKLKRGLMGLVCVLAAQGAWAQKQTFLVNGLYPGVSITNMKPTTGGLSNDAIRGQPDVGSMVWLPDGRLFIASMDDPTGSWSGYGSHFPGPSNGYMFSNLPNATSNAGVTVATVASGFYLPLGGTVVDDTIFVSDDSNGIMKLVPKGDGTYTRKVLYHGILGAVSGKSNGATGGTSCGDRRWGAGLLYKDGFFYSAIGMGMCVGGTSDEVVADIYRGSGTVMKVSRDGAVIDTFAGGVRNPVSMNWGPDSQMFMTITQGSYLPASAMFNVRKGRFFGHRNTPYDDQPVSPPAVIFPYGSSPTSTSTTDPMVSGCTTDFLFLKNGPYPGQMMVGENQSGGMHRVFLEKINGEYQGAVIPFSQGLGYGSTAGVIPEFKASVNRLSYGPDGNIYLGGGSGKGSSGSGAWGFAGSNQWGLAQLKWNGTPVFEIKAVRSLSATQMQIEFSEPVTAVAPSNFTINQGGYLEGGTANTASYGAGKLTENNVLTVTDATLDLTKTKATLTITGLKQRTDYTPAQYAPRAWGFVQQIQVKNVAAVSGRAMWGGGTLAGGVAWYTTNTFGPGVDVEAPPSTNIVPNRDGSPGLHFQWKGEALAVQSPVTGAYTLQILDARGRITATFVAGGGTYNIPASALQSGLNLIVAKTTGGRWASMVAKP